MKPISLVLFLLASQSFAYPQEKVFEWNAFDCAYEGSYDTLNVTEKQLKDHWFLCFSHFWELSRISKSSIDSLDKEYKLKLNKLENLQISKSSFWQNLKKERLNYISNIYQLFRITILAYQNPMILREYQSTYPCKYTDALVEGGESMFAAWKEVAEIKSMASQNPDYWFKTLYLDKLDSPNKDSTARFQLMSLGWWDICVIQNVPHLTPDLVLDEEFKKLFKKVKKLGCNEED